MTNQLSNLIRIAGVTILITFLWAVSIAFTYWDVHRQQLSAVKTWLWLVLVSVLPLIGFVLYIFSRVVSLLIPFDSHTLVVKTRRETLLKPPLMKRKPMPTLHVSSLVRQTVLEPSSDPLSNADHLAGSGNYVFSISSGAEAGKQFIIDNLPTTIGRGSQASIRLDGDLGVSREHALVYDQAGELRLRDLKSTHGTRVNGIRIEDQRLANGDQVQVGLTTLVVMITKS